MLVNQVWATFYLCVNFVLGKNLLIKGDINCQCHFVQLALPISKQIGLILFNAHTHTNPFNGPFSGTTRVSWYQKGKTNLAFTKTTDSEWQWHQLGHMQVSTSLQTHNHASTSLLSFYRPDALPAAKPTASKH